MSTRGGSAATFASALAEGLAPDGGLYMPERVERWPDEALARLAAMSPDEAAAAALRPYVGDEIPDQALRAAAASALSFPIPLVTIAPGLFALELFHGPTLAFKDVGARMMARLIVALQTADGRRPLTVLVATSGDTGGAVAHAFAGIPATRVVVLYPHGHVSPTQEAQLTAFNGDDGANVRAYAVEGSFDDCQRLVKAAFANEELRREARLTSANSINVGRLLPQMAYYLHASAALVAAGFGSVVFSTPSGNFGNLTAGVMAARSGAPVDRFVAATNVNDVVPAYLDTGVFAPRRSIHTIANAMDCGNPSNFDRLLWLYGGSVERMRREVAGSVHTDQEVRDAIRRIDREHGYLMDPHTAIAYLGAETAGQAGQAGQAGRAREVARVFLATAHPAKFAEVVEPIVGRKIDVPPALASVLAAPRRVFSLDATDSAVRGAVERAG